MASTTAAETTPEISQKGADSGDEMQDVMFARRGCCHWMPCFSSEQSSTYGSMWERITMTNASSPEKELSWWSKGLKKIREWSEIVAGPRWKTFIRRFNKNRIGKNGKFQYDPSSYARNFDEGPWQDDHFDDDRVYRDFSSRYAAIPISAKSSMDLGRDGPSFT